MLISKTSPAGIDYKLQELQTLLHDSLLTKWGINTSAYKCYGRCYRNKTDKGYIAENYEGSGEYKEVYWDDSLAAISFFGTGVKTKYDAYEATDVHLVFFVNLATLKSSITHRADEEVKADVIDLIKPATYGFEYIGFETGLDNVLREYPGSRRDERLTIADMHPVHCFRINMTTLYDINSNNCAPLKTF